MQINFNSFSSQAVSFFKEVVLPPLTAQQKKIMGILALAFSCLALCYVGIRHLKIRKIQENKASLLEKESSFLSKKLELAKQAGPTLTKLDLTQTALTNQELEELSQVCPNIQEINLKGCNNLKGAALDKLPQGLQSLNLKGCKQLTDAGLDKLPQGLHSHRRIARFRGSTTNNTIY